MTCQEVLERLDDYVDGALTESEFQEIELHLTGCPDCREEERLSRSILAQASALSREVEPSRDLWAGIASRISERKTPGLRTYFPSLLAAALVLVGILTRLHPVPQATPAPALGELQPAALLEPSLANAEMEYGRATDALKAALDARRASVSPETLKTVDQDLRLIDAALDSLRSALAKEPGNEELSRLLISTHQRKLDLLESVTRLSNTL